MSDSGAREREIGGLLEASSATGCDNLSIITVDEETELTVNGKSIRVTPAWKRLLAQ